MYKLKIGNTTTNLIGTPEGDRLAMRGKVRNCIKLHFNKSESEVKALFNKDGIEWSIVCDELGVEKDYDKSNYSLVGDLIKHTDNTTSIYLCEITDQENIASMQEIIDALS